MFYCESCAKKNSWPFDWYLAASRGPCEVCHKTAVCADVHHSLLPVPEKQPDPEESR